MPPRLGIPAMGWPCFGGKHSCGELGLLGFPALQGNSPPHTQHVPSTSPHPGNTLSSIGRCEVTSLGSWGAGGRGASWEIRAQIPLLPSIQVPHRAKGSPPPAPSSLDKGAGSRLCFSGVNRARCGLIPQLGWICWRLWL